MSRSALGEGPLRHIVVHRVKGRSRNNDRCSLSFHLSTSSLASIFVSRSFDSHYSEINRSAGHVFSPYKYNSDKLGSVGEGLSLVGGALDAFSTAPWMDINQVSVDKPVTIYSKKLEDVSQTAQVGFRIHMAVTGTTIATLLGIFLCCAVGCIVKRW